MNYAKFTTVLAGSMALKTYLEDQKIIPKSIQKYSVVKRNMASIAIVIGGAVLNATSFIGGNYLARYLSGDDKAQAEKERKRYDHALEKYNDAVERFREGQEKLQDFIAEMTGSNIRPFRIS